MARYIALIFVSLLATLGAAGASSAAHSPGAAVGHRLGGWMYAHADPKHAWLYVSGWKNNVVNIYDIGRLMFRKIGQITDGVNGPNGLSVDGNGNLYVSNSTNVVRIYAPGATSPTLSLSQGLTQANAAVADSNGDVYVTNSGGSRPDVVVYPPGSSVPSETITSNLFSRPYGEVFDAAGNQYISDWNLGVCMIPAGSQVPVPLNLQGGGQPAGIAFDSTTWQLFVNYFYSPRHYRTLVYAMGSTTPTRALKGNQSADGLVIGTIRRSTYLFVPDFGSNDVYVYKHNKKGPMLVVTTDSESANGVAFKPAGVP